jgi:SAM-dependent methyltransferase
VGRVSRSVRRLARPLNRRRLEIVMRELDVQRGDRILELGCGRGRHSIATAHPALDVVGVDVLSPAVVKVDAPRFRYVQADAADLSMFDDGMFDVAVSFGMLEHIRPPDRLQAATREARRVAGRYCFVVPHRYAFIEPHFLLPLFPIWPGWLKRAATGRFALGSQPRTPGGQYQQIQWLTKAEWRRVFDDPNLRILDHWYGPVLLDYLILGGTTLRPERHGSA